MAGFDGLVATSRTGRVGEAHAHRPQLGADRPTDPPGEVRVADRAERHVAGERRRAIAEGHELAALLVGRDEERWRRAGSRRRDAAWRASVSSRTWPGEATLENRKRVTPAAGSLANRSAIQARQPLALEGDHESPEDGARIGRCVAGGHPLTAPASPRTK